MSPPPPTLVVWGTNTSPTVQQLQNHYPGNGGLGSDRSHVLENFYSFNLSNLGSQTNPHIFNFSAAFYLQSMNSSTMGKGNLALHLFFQIYGVILRPKLLNPKPKNLVCLLPAGSFFPEAIKPDYLPRSIGMKRKSADNISVCDPSAHFFTSHHGHKAKGTECFKT